MELSTQILINEARKRNYNVDILDEKSNFIRIKSGDKVEYIKQATKTSLDNYATVLIMENKYITNMILSDNNIRVPRGVRIGSEYDLEKLYKEYGAKKVVVKPINTNFGLGITILDKFTIEQFGTAIEFALEYDSSILIEEFIEGKEYRFFVIGNEVEGVLHRVPANVTGDGKSTIRELVNEKNNDDLRGENYIKPLQKIKLGKIEEEYVRNQGYDFETVLQEGKTIYLRENSNISTGGDSIDFTDDIHETYKKIALEAAKVVNAKITGIDIMISNIKEPANEFNHGVIEMNFNPAIHIHHYPYIGKGRNLAGKVLDLLFE